ncbi:RNA pseudouridine synthase 2, chloroplastic [Henckelia pumila]|uniref:RNA pseudouridine synthase 2, chloroplastic n=1 Tax=Henckelia pumila TaxID=405737 RepID=UPI003C6E4956
MQTHVKSEKCVLDAALGKSENIRILVALIHLKYKVIEVLAGGGCALVEWRLETGRTHQIRAHAKYLGVPLLGDDVYGGTKNMALSLLQSRNSPSCHSQLFQLVSKLERPCLHALTLGFEHPRTGERLRFSQVPPLDFLEILDQLRHIFN